MSKKPQNFNKMEKTAKEWFETFPEPYRTQALENAEKELLNFNFSSALEAVKGTFFWDDSPEGHDYWHDFKNNYFTKANN